NKIDFYSELIQNKEGFEPAVKFILDNRDDFPGIKGALSELIYTDQKYYQAIEAYLSDLSELIVAEDKQAALKSIKKLEQMDKGRVTIIPMNLKINGKMQNGQINEAEALAPQVKCRNEMKPIKNFIFSDVYFCDDQNFDELVKSPDFDNKVLVTEQGRISNNGFLTGGEQASGNLLVGREDQLNEFEKQYDQLSFEHEDLEGELSTLNQRKKQIKNKLQNLSSSIEKTKNQIRKNEKQKDQLDNKIYRLDTELKSWNEKRVNLKVTIKNFKNKLKTDSPGLEKLQNQITDLDNKIGDKKEELKLIEEQLNKQNTALQNARVERVNLKNKLRNAKENEKAALKSIRKFQQKKETDKQKIETRKKNKKELSQKIQKNTLELEKVEKEVKKYKDKVYNISQKYRQKRKKIQSLNEEMLKKRQSREYLSDEIKKLELKLSDYRSKQKEIKAVLAKQYEKKIIDPLDDQELPELEKAEKKVERLKKRLEKIGTVNMEVKDEYEKESERLSFLEEQRDDLVESRESLQQIIEEIDEVAREKFMTTFEQIKENFQSIFNIFFKGGEADLKLLGDDPLDSKIEIFARPGGKKLRSIRMLSAGEKTLTAIALVFGIYQVKPSPFCILDEVDAPLDDANTRRFLEMIDSFSDNTQFIIVTHNKITMSAADNLYGVTMAEKGVSQIVSTKMEEEIQQLI
ncbi:MAG: hypothetical protein K9N00_01145, partial [Candidatus Marinimicrobia bacterium]|nr:hypothetical protein [Candidatus Neomarinimicrobiota bacterium]